MEQAQTLIMKSTKNIVTLAIKLSLYFVVTVIIFYLLNCGDVYLDFMIVLLLRFLC